MANVATASAISQMNQLLDHAHSQLAYSAAFAADLLQRESGCEGGVSSSELNVMFRAHTNGEELWSRRYEHMGARVKKKA